VDWWTGGNSSPVGTPWQLIKTQFRRSITSSTPSTDPLVAGYHYHRNAKTRLGSGGWTGRGVHRKGHPVAPELSLPEKTPPHFIFTDAGPRKFGFVRGFPCWP